MAMNFYDTLRSFTEYTEYVRMACIQITFYEPAWTARYSWQHLGASQERSVLPVLEPAAVKR